jgi:hypothetical protein
MSGAITLEKGETVRVRSGSSGSAVIRAAKKLRAIKRRAAEADAELLILMRARYGDHDEMPDSLVEIIEYPNGADFSLTLAYIDEEMTAAGFPPNKADMASGKP